MPPEPSAAQPAAAAPAPPTSSAHPDEVSVFLELASKYAAEHRESEAVALLSRLLLRHPELSSDERVARALSLTARSDQKSVGDESFALLEGPLGERGAEILYDLSLSRDVSERVRRRADDWLRSKDFDRTSSPALYSAVRLRHAKTCEQKHNLLELAGNVGGKRTLDYLRELSTRTTCNPSFQADCYPCLAGDDKLKDAITKIESRVHE
jgi:hypothetical protein